MKLFLRKLKFYIYLLINKYMLNSFIYSFIHLFMFFIYLIFIFFIFYLFIFIFKNMCIYTFNINEFAYIEKCK